VHTACQTFTINEFVAALIGMLMMGGLSPGLKRHSVSLFEGALTLREAPVNSACKLLEKLPA